MTILAIARADPRGIPAVGVGSSIAPLRIVGSDAIAPIVIVEDDRNALSGYLEYLTDAGYDVIGVAEAEAALLLTHKCSPQAVITDITLPGMSGFDFTAALRAHARTKDVPVIGLTANWSRDVHERAAAVHMSAVLLKPCLPLHLLAELQRLAGAPGR
jgi:CheY-like chemotaxis protein